MLAQFINKLLGFYLVQLQPRHAGIDVLLFFKQEFALFGNGGCFCWLILARRLAQNIQKVLINRLVGF